MIAFLFSTAGLRIAGAVGAVLLLLAAYAYVDHRGYERAAVFYQGQIAEMKAAAIEARDTEINRQLAANNAAKAREAQRLAEMQAENDNLQNMIEGLQREASEDPDAGRAALSASGVRRVNKVR